MITKPFLVLFLLWLAPANAAGQSEIPERSPDRWLEHMYRAFAELNYDGVFSYFDGSELSTLRIVHLVKDGIEHERLMHLNGAPREFIRTGDKVVCLYEPGDKLLEFENTIPSGPFARAFTASFERVSRHYELTMSESDRVADRDAVRLAISPVDDHRYGYRLWLDAETGLLLRSELVDNDGARLEIFQFTHVTISDDIDPSALDPESGDDAVRTYVSLDAGVSVRENRDGARWRAGWVPEGFEMAASDIRRAQATLGPVHTLMYSDDLAAFSVFVEEKPESATTGLVSRSGATVAVTSTVSGPNGGEFLVTVVGEIPEETAWRVARSVAYHEDS